MKLSLRVGFAVLCVSLLESTLAFQVSTTSSNRERHGSSKLKSLDGTDAESLDMSAITAGPKQKLLDLATGLKEKYGVFIVDKQGQEDLRRAVEELESVVEQPAFDEDAKKTMLGHWTLVCTTSQLKTLPSPLGGGIDTSKLPFFNEGPLKDLRENLNKCLVVQQAILAQDSGEIDRVDHILEYKPPSNLQDIIDRLPSLNINPLDVTKGKFVLVHEADVSNVGPPFSIRLKLASIVVNVAGTSQFFDPDGKDVLGINSPLKEFQAGTFETTYLDDNLRISRTNMGTVDQLRVYIRTDEETTDGDLDEEYFDEFDKFGEDEDEDLDPGLES